ncbi:MAG: sterol desaturase family protein [Bacteriovoracaceae bacterium]|nr:sterol desaturase family protein [Bacteriovoracaceae bacterium]
MGNELNLMNIYSFITPLAVGLILLEILYCLVSRKNYITFADAITNLGTALGNQCVNLLVVWTVVTTFGWLYQYRFFDLPNTWGWFLVLLVAFDFLFYWFHRHGHTINILWAAHMSHHTSEEFNFFVATRASITQRIFSFTYMWPLALLGFRPEAIYAASAVQLLLAFWHHTRVIGKMPGFEILFNSPSYHRVHHAINDKYLDKNFGEIFIIWDKMFGTCEKEVEEPIFGALTPPQTCNPNKIYVQYWAMLWRDCMNTKSLWDKVRLWFMPLGWRPEDVRNMPRFRVNEKTFKKYEVKVDSGRKAYLIVQAALGVALMGLTINLQLPFSVAERVWLSVLIWLMITSWGGLLEKKNWAWKLEGTRLALTVFTLVYLAQGRGMI